MQKLKEKLRPFEEGFTAERKQEFREKRKLVIKKGNLCYEDGIHAKLHNRYSWGIVRILIGPGATLSLIPGQLISQMSLTT